MQKSLATSLLVIMAACSQEPKSSDVQSVEDISSMSQRSDGRFEVRCRNGELEIRSASDIRANRVCEFGGGGGGGGSHGALLCVSRDNDGQDPWMLAALTSQGTATKIAGTVYGPNVQCQDALHSMRTINHGESLLCISRDNDGQNPWLMASYNESTQQLTRIANTNHADFQTCIESIRATREWNGRSFSCVSRDNDGRDPWILSAMDGAGQVVRITNLQYATNQDCRMSLDRVRFVSQNIMICGSRDRDGRDPWNLYRIDQNQATRLEVTFGTLSACLHAN
jgi:hypothetical protein